MKFLVLQDCYVESHYFVKGVTADLPDKYKEATVVFQPIENDSPTSEANNPSEEPPLYVSDKPKTRKKKRSRR